MTVDAVALRALRERIRAAIPAWSPLDEGMDSDLAMTHDHDVIVHMLDMADLLDENERVTLQRDAFLSGRDHYVEAFERVTADLAEHDVILDEHIRAADHASTEVERLRGLLRECVDVVCEVQEAENDAYTAGVLAFVRDEIARRSRAAVVEEVGG